MWKIITRMIKINDKGIYVRFDASLPLPDVELQFHPSDHHTGKLRF